MGLKFAALPDHDILIDYERYVTHLMLSASVAHAPTAFVTLTRRAWLVLVNKLTRGEIPPALRIEDLLGGI